MRPSEIIVLPGASSAQGIAKGVGSTFYAGDLWRGHIYRGDLEQGTAEIFIYAPEGRLSMGLWADLEHGLLFVGGGLGWAYAYDIETGKEVAVWQFGTPDDLKSTLVNKVFVNQRGAYFSDTSCCVLYHVPISPAGELGPPSTLTLSGPAAEVSGHFNLNGIAAPDAGEPLIVSHTAKGRLYTVDPDTGVSREIEGVNVRSADGLLLEGRHLWVVQNWASQVSRVRLSDDLSSGTVESVITDDAFQFPTTAIAVGSDRIAIVNAKSDTGIVPTAKQYEVVIVDR
jgi:outer membrane protein assembly factor BamB